MDIKSIKHLAQKYSAAELEEFARILETTGEAPVKTQEDLGEQMSDYLQAGEVRKLLDQGMPLPLAIREFSKRVRGVL